MLCISEKYHDNFGNKLLMGILIGTAGCYLRHLCYIFYVVANSLLMNFKNVFVILAIFFDSAIVLSLFYLSSIELPLFSMVLLVRIIY